MKKAALRKIKYTPAVRRKLREVIYDFHVPVFGEEMARVNHLPLAERRKYIGEMIDHATRKGVRFHKPARGHTP